MYFTKMTKNNLKLMLRCRALVLIVICMVMVTGMLSAVFKDLLSDNFYIGDFTLGVSFGEDCVYAPAKSAIQAAFDHENTVVIDIPYGSGQKAIESKKADVVAEFNNQGCTVYSDGNHETEAGFVSVTASSIISKSSDARTYNHVNAYKIDVLPMPGSELYYTAAYTVFFVWVSMIALGAVMSSERKNKIGARFKTAPVSSFNIYLSRFIPSAIMIAALIFTGVAICTWLFDIEWLKIATTALLLILGCIAAAALATVLFSLIKNVILTIVFGYCLLVFWAFFGGSFCPYMQAPWADTLRNYSPIYYMTRSIVELNTSGSSEFTVPAIIVLCGISVVCIPLGMIAVKLGKED